MYVCCKYIYCWACDCHKSTQNTANTSTHKYQLLQTRLMGKNTEKQHPSQIKWIVPILKLEILQDLHYKSCAKLKVLNINTKEETDVQKTRWWWKDIEMIMGKQLEENYNDFIS